MTTTAPLERVLEPEVMDTEQEALDYDAIDHFEVNTQFCEDFLAFCAESSASPARVLDVGTGTAQIPIALCSRAGAIRVEAIDLAEHMLAMGRRNVERAGFRDRVTLRKADAKGSCFADGSFDAVLSNSIVHHIPDPPLALRDMWRVLMPGGILFVRDLSRPASMAELTALLAHHAPVLPGELESAARQRALFAASLHAALTYEEIGASAASLGIPPGALARTSDRHWTLAAIKPQSG